MGSLQLRASRFLFYKVKLKIVFDAHAYGFVLVFIDQ